MRKISFLLSIILLLLQSCETSYEFKYSSSPILYVQCCPGVRDTTIFQILEASVVGAMNSTPRILDVSEIDFTVNGFKKDVCYTYSALGTIPPRCYYVPRPMNAGDVVEIKAVLDGISEITAKTTVPDKVPEFECRITKSMVSVDLPIDKDEKFFYGIDVIVEGVGYFDDGTSVVEVRCARPEIKLSDLWGEPDYEDYIDVQFNGWAFGSARDYVRVWNHGVDGKTESRLSMPYYTPVFSFENKVKKVELRYKVRLYAFTKEFYRYAALVTSRHDELSSMGLAPTNNKYFTNINDGCGIMAGWNRRDSEWKTLN